MFLVQSTTSSTVDQEGYSSIVKLDPHFCVQSYSMLPFVAVVDTSKYEGYCVHITSILIPARRQTMMAHQKRRYRLAYSTQCSNLQPPATGTARNGRLSVLELRLSYTCFSPRSGQVYPFSAFLFVYSSYTKSRVHLFADRITNNAQL